MKKQFFEKGCFVRDTQKGGFNKNLAKSILKEVMKRLETGSKKYGEGYLLEDFDREIYEELLDTIGWTLLSAMCYLEVMRGVEVDVNNVIWDRFVRHHSKSFLEWLKKKIDKELERRKKDTDPIVGKS